MTQLPWPTMCQSPSPASSAMVPPLSFHLSVEFGWAAELRRYPRKRRDVERSRVTSRVDMPLFCVDVECLQNQHCAIDAVPFMF